MEISYQLSFNEKYYYSADYLIKYWINLISEIDKPCNLISGLSLITLHGFAGYAPKTFFSYKLDNILREMLNQIPSEIEFDPLLSCDEALALVDILYVYKQHNNGNYKRLLCFNEISIINYLANLLENGNIMYYWLIGEILNLLGTNLGSLTTKHTLRPYKNKNKLYDLYWLTHIFFLKTEYFHKPLQGDFSNEISELLGVSNWIIQLKNIDLAAEASICLSVAGKTQTQEYKSLVNLLCDEIQGFTNKDLSFTDFDFLHTISVSMVALANFLEK